MKNNRDLIIHKELIFALLLVFGIVYLLLLSISSIQLGTGLLMHVVHFLENLRYNAVDIRASFSFEIVACTAIGIYLLYLWKLFLVALKETFRTVKNTTQFLNQVTHNYSPSLNCRILPTKRIYAFTAGLMRSQVFVSQGLTETLNNAELKAVLLHEQHHQKTHDPLRKLIIQFIRSATPWLPFKKAIFQNYDVLTEISADLHAKSTLDNELPLISAVNKLFSLESISFINSTAFSLLNERIPILLGREAFKFKPYYALILTIIIMSVFSTVLMSNTSLTHDCSDLYRCIANLFANNHMLENNGRLICDPI